MKLFALLLAFFVSLSGFSQDQKWDGNSRNLTNESQLEGQIYVRKDLQITVLDAFLIDHLIKSQPDRIHLEGFKKLELHLRLEDYREDKSQPFSHGSFIAFAEDGSVVDLTARKRSVFGISSDQQLREVVTFTVSDELNLEGLKIYFIHQVNGPEKTEHYIPIVVEWN